MFWLSIAGGIFLVWLVLVFLFTPGINYHLAHRTSVHDEGLPLHAPVHLPGGAASRQPRDGVHQRPGVLPGDARGDPPGDALGQHGVLHLPAGEGRRTSSSTALSAKRARQASTSPSSSTRIGSLSAVGPARSGGCARRAAASQSYQRLRVVLAGAPQQPHAPRAARRRRPRRVRRRRRHRGLVGVPTFKRLRWQQAVARHDGAHRGAGRRGAAGRGRRELARVLRRDHHRPGLLPRPEAVRRHDRVRREELAVGSRHRVARHVPAPDGRRPIEQRPHQHAVFPAGPRAPPRARARSARRGVTISVIVPGAQHRSEVGAPGEPAHVGRAARRRGSASSSTASTMTHAKVLHRRRPVGGARDDEHRQPIVRAQRRGQPGDAGPAVAARLLQDYERDIARQRRDHAGRVAAPAAVGEGRRAVRLDPGATAVTEPKSAAPVRRRPDRDLQHPPLPRHGSPHHAVAHRRGHPRRWTPTSSRCRR